MKHQMQTFNILPSMLDIFEKETHKYPITKLISLIKVEDSCTGNAIYIQYTQEATI
jgi:hypothetical protein